VSDPNPLIEMGSIGRDKVSAEGYVKKMIDFSAVFVVVSLNQIRN